MQYIIEADGSVYPCDFYVLDKYKVGNIKEDSIFDLLKSKILKDFINEPRIKVIDVLTVDIKNM